MITLAVFRFIHFNCFSILFFRQFFVYSFDLFLRELSISPDTKVCLITISRRTIQEIEPHNGAISNFYGVFSEIRLLPFHETDMKKYWNRLENLGIEVSKEYKDEISYYAGTHPYLLDLINFYVFNEMQTSDKNSLEILGEVGSSLRVTLWNNYEHILSLLEEEALKSHFIQVVVGPKLNVTSRSIEKMLKYGLIKTLPAKEKYSQNSEMLFAKNLINENDISYNSFSNHLDEYLKQKEVEFDIWPLWTETEKGIRNLVKKYLKEKYGDSWEEEFILKNPNKQKELENLKATREKNKKSFGEMASSHLVDYTYPQGLWDLFFTDDWNWFQKVLGNQKASWQEKFFFLAKVRNPIAHSNQEFVNREEQAKAKQICEEILFKIEAH
ncbi:MAG: Swt1 family HEPN domain-containing protein [Leptospiraceae bacterium]|nr:Swt1 family HEPN domain-containing protein [Leptospiraceae bacterium]